jgi:hypothetical protein
MIICGRGARRAKAQTCSTCGSRPATLLCDGPPPPRLRGGVGATCSQPLCETCAHRRGQGDFCDACLPLRPRLAL